MEFSENLLRRRKALGLSQEELAGKIQVSRQAVSKWETGDTMPDLPKLLALVEALDLSLDVLCGRETEATVSEAIPTPSTKSSRLWPALCVVLLCLLAATGFWGWNQRNLIPTEEPAAVSSLPDTLVVTGVSFSGHSNRVDYQFVPSSSGPDYTYQIVFTDSTGNSRAFDTVCSSGVCSGTAAIAPYDTFQVTVTVSDGVASRSVAIATDLTFTNYSASWIPVEP